MRLTAKDRSDLHARFDGRCAYCGTALGERWHADHVDPVIRQTRYERGKGWQRGDALHPQRDCLENLMPACAPCNISKGPYCLEGWRGELAKTLGIMRRNYPTYRTAIRFGMVSETVAPIVFHFERANEHRTA